MVGGYTTVRFAVGMLRILQLDLGSPRQDEQVKSLLLHVVLRHLVASFFIGDLKHAAALHFARS